MKEKLWLFVVKFIAVSALLFVFWHFTGALEGAGTSALSGKPGWYLIFLNHVMSFLLIKIAGFNILCFPAPKPMLINLIPFVSLMIITRGIKLKTRITQIMGGLLILIIWHMILTEAVYLLLDCRDTSPAYEKLSVPLYLFSGTLPFVLWILFARKQMAGLFLRRKKKTK
ncbi:MAG: hypothetical protein KAW02_05185 [candidate division Zixibacteria bacterium]|nr:hypothetical protein [candidate division Zixibacteria bacterium]